MLKKILPVIFVTLLALLLVGIKWYPELSSFWMKHADKGHDGRGTVQTGRTSYDQKHSRHRDPLLSEDFPFENKQQEAFAKKYPKQFHIVKKMYYSWDYVDNAQGEFEWGDSQKNMERIRFYVDFENKRNFSEDEKIKDGKVIETERVLLKDGVAVRQLTQKHLFTKETIKNNPRASAAGLETHYLGLYNRFVTSSEWYALIYNNYPDWTYKTGEKFGLPVYQIEGEITPEISEELTGRFTMTVAKETGVLLDLKCYGKGRKVIFFVTVKDIQINRGIKNPQAVFRLDVSGDKEVSRKVFNLSGVGSQAEGEKSGWDR